MKEANVALSPGIGFGPMGEGFVRFSLIEDDVRLLEATRRIGGFLQGEHAGAAVSSAPAHV
jgi:aspartate/methionine/tyrosine aminotransferase